MKGKFWLFAGMAALCVSVIVLLVLMSRINDARSDLAQASPGAFNYLLQSNRNLDSFIDALRISRISDSSLEEQRLQRKLYQQRFDVLWGGFTVFELNFRYRSEQEQQVTEMIEYATDYLEKNESLMVPDYALSDSEVNELIAGARSISDRITEIGHQYFIYATERTDVWNTQFRRLYHWFWVCAFLLMLTSALLIGMLLRSVKRSSTLIKESHDTQRQMSRLIDELRSGKLENKAKDSFIAAASHDLRQPLHALGLFLSSTEKHIQNDAGREALAEAKRCTTELNRLFNGLLDLSRLDAGVVEANKSRFQLNRLLRLMDQEFSALASQKGIRFDVCEDLYHVHTDALLLNRVLRNLLENAFAHSGATEIRIICKRNDDVVRLTISDNGAGIPLEEQSDIFSEYYQLDNPERDRSKGLGLGLSIVKRLCEILSIQVTLESRAGSGTLFHLDVPAGSATSPPSSEPAEIRERHRTAPAGTLVAIIDDDINVRRGMISMLESLDFRAIAAESAVEMIRILRMRELSPDLIVADYRLLKNQTGDMAIHEVRSAFGIEFPAMIITGDTSPGRMKEATKSGFELLHKPVEPGELMERINKLLMPVREAIAEAN